MYLLHGLDSLKTGLDIIQGRIKKPVLTKKIIPLIGLILTLAILFLSFFVQKVVESQSFTFTFIRLLILYSILTPFIVSFIVLAFQPLAVIGRNRILKKARERRKRFKNLIVIGITGSYGKTTTKEFLAHILREKFHVLKTPEHTNSEVGISNTILRSLTNVHNVFVCEMGAYNKGGIKLLAEIAQPKIGIITGVNQQHLALFGSMENLLSAEGGEELVAALPKNGTAIFNGNSEYIEKLYKKTKIEKKFIKPPKNIRTHKEYITFEVNKTSFKVNVLGAHNAENILLAAQAAQELGMSLREIAKALETAPSEISPMKMKKGMNGLTIIDSTYSANPDGVIADLEYVKVWKGKKVIVMPCLIELGKASKEVHKKIGEKIAEVCDLAIITTKDYVEDVKEGVKVVEVKPRPTEVVCIESPQEIFERVKGFNGKEDIVLLESRVSQSLLDLLYDQTN
ncbi:UDP-N-acetylmuramoyl-tripeptide--D-alanyl-D-alanine ligase [Patescibacteria group bacterium]|nr:UDP-N-acetylmuramoyl-tripeptide--D-alanyl-D-alanine ligase [Patescibacteria group bacterium]